MEIDVEGYSKIHDDHAGGIPEAGLQMPGHAFYCGLPGEEILVVAADNRLKLMASQRPIDTA